MYEYVRVCNIRVNNSDDEILRQIKRMRSKLKADETILDGFIPLFYY